jgi:glucokinase
VPEASSVGELEALASGPAIARAAQRRLQAGEPSRLSRLNHAKVTAHEVARAARQGDRLASDVFDRAGRFLGFAVANLVSLLDPEIIVIGGGMAAAADLYLDALRNAMFERAQPLAVQQVAIRASRLGDKVNLLGCARLGWKSLEDRS